MTYLRARSKNTLGFSSPTKDPQVFYRAVNIIGFKYSALNSFYSFLVSQVFITEEAIRWNMAVAAN